MKFVALLSGGKDSCYNIQHCITQGHELIALANLYPSSPGVDELDSHMFQTVGHDIVQHYAECTGVPLYREAITGSSKNQTLEYQRTTNDEIEDLFVLLQRVQQAHPEVRGVSVGAILSAYQRTRVEDVCSRLGLTSLAYLWQRDQSELMGEMAASGLDARLIKVAAIGLDASHLGQTIQTMYPLLVRLNERYDVHVCGEGGEFETMVFDAPFFVKRMEIVELRVVEVSADGVCYLKFTVEVIAKPNTVPILVVLPPLLEELYLENEGPSLWKVSPRTVANELAVEAKVGRSETSLYVSNLTGAGETAAEQTRAIFTKLEALLSKHGFTHSEIHSTSLLVSSMATFGEINQVYGTHFPGVLPPARVCVETFLPERCLLQLSCVVRRGAKRGVHVQGLSYWAPCNIGPYSQAIVDTAGVAHLAGQIPLVPATMTLHAAGTAAELWSSALLSLQHLRNVQKLVRCPQTVAMMCFVTDTLTVALAAEAWNRFGKGSLTIVLVRGLPRGARVEWGGLAFDPQANPRDMYYDSEDEEAEDREAKAMRERLDQLGGASLTVGLWGFVTLYFNHTDDVRHALSLPKTHYLVYAAPAVVKAMGGLDTESVEYIPVAGVWDSQGREWAMAITARSES